MAFVQHEYCVQHGLWTHSETHDHGDVVHEKSEDGTSSLAVVYGRTGADHEHEHCHVLVERRDEWIGASMDRYGIAPVLDVAGIQRITPYLRDLSATYLFAPKVSPPFAA